MDVRQMVYTKDHGLLFRLFVQCAILANFAASGLSGCTPQTGGRLQGTVDENVIPGTVVTVPFSCDQSPTGYALSGADSSKFNIDTIGVISTVVVPDYESTTSYTDLVLTVSNAAGDALFDMTISILNLNDVTSVCSPTAYFATTAENTATGVLVATVACTDGDVSPYDSLTYSIASGDDATTPKFQILVPATPQITTFNALDYEAKTFYTLVVEASDGANVASATVYVTVGSVNEYNPAWGAFVPVGLTHSVSENAAGGTSLVTVAASDADDGDAGSVVFSVTAVTDDSSNSAMGSFYVDATTGELFTAVALDRDTVLWYDVVIEASDEGTPAKTSAETIRVNLDDVNDIPPQFSQAVYSAVVTEGDSVNTVVQTLAATDADPTPTTFTYSITGGDLLTLFKIVGDEVQVAVVIDLDPNTSHPMQYFLEVEVDDGAGNTGEALVHVTVTSSNDHSPASLAATPLTIIVSESESPGYSVATVSGSDGDFGTDGEFTFSIASGDPGPYFLINPQTGEIEIERQIDYETLTPNPVPLVVRATDKGTPSRSTDLGVSVTVTDANDNAPACSPNAITAVLREDASAGANVATLVCSDADTGTFLPLAYSIASVDGVGGPGDFAIDASGVVTLATASLDYEVASSHEIIVEVRDTATPTTGQLTSSVWIAVVVSDVNDHDPVFTPWSVNNLPESTAVGTSIDTIVATDADTADTIAYSFSPASGSFQIDALSGEITTRASLDRETVDTHELVVLAVDSGTVDAARTTTSTYTVSLTDVNDNTPAFSPTVYVAAATPENAAIGTTLLSVTATDVDAGSFGAVTYAIAGGNVNSKFRVNTNGAALGEIIVDLSLDYEAKSHYTLSVEARDGGGRASTAAVTVNVLPINEYPPVFSPSDQYSVSVPENTALGSSVASFVATDADQGIDGDFVFNVVSSSGHLNVDSATGAVILIASLDRETATSYELIVEAVDLGVSPGALSATATLSLTALDYNDKPPACSPVVYSRVLAEDAAGGSAVATLACSDADSDPLATNNALSFAVVAGVGSSNFVVDSGSGVVTVAATPAFDYESATSYQVLIKVTDLGSPALSSTATIDVQMTGVNEHSPVFGSAAYTASVAEDAATADPVIQVPATDADDGTDGILDYEIVSGNPDGNFYVEPSNGWVYVGASLDREDTDTFVLAIHAVDRGTPSLTGSATLTVTVDDVNDNAPTCPTSLYLGAALENSAASTAVVTLVCSDADIGVNSLLQYRIIAGNANDWFAIGLVSGQLTVGPGATLDAETDESFMLTVEVRDRGAVPLTLDVAVRVAINDVNEYAPQFQPSNAYAVSLSEASSVGTSVQDIDAADSDTGVNGEIVFQIASGDPDGRFFIDPNSGLISLQRTLDRETSPSYTLIVNAMDLAPAPNTNTSQATVVVTVNDVNDNAPDCPGAAYSVDVAEDSAFPSATLLVVLCPDADIGVNGQVTYTIDSGNSEGKFDLDASSGALTLIAALDYETTIVYQLEVTAQDSGAGALSAQTTVIVNVLSVNEHSPMFDRDEDTLIIAEDTPIDTLIYVPTATDADDGRPGVLVYDIQYDDPDHLRFLIDSDTGKVRVGASLDYDTDPKSYDLNITVYDNGGDLPNKVDVLMLVINLSDVNDNSPVFTQDAYTQNVYENLLGNQVLTTAITASDADSGLNAELEYSIDSGHGTSHFYIDPATGDLLTSASPTLDREVQDSYSLLIKVVDKGVPARSSYCTVTIILDDLNDNAPVFSIGSLTVSVSENQMGGALVTSVQAVDADIGNNAFLAFSIDPATDSHDHFSITKTTLDTAEIKTTRPLDREKIAQYILGVYVVDNGSPALGRSATVTVVVNDLNDNSPVITRQPYIASLRENVPVGTVVFTIGTLDADTGLGGAGLQFAIRSGDGGQFQIDPATGVVSTRSVLDRESTDHFLLSVEVSDGGIPALTATTTATVYVQDVNDNRPRFTDECFFFYVPENTAKGTSVGSVSTTDADLGMNARVGYTLLEARTGAEGHFLIDYDTGVIYTQVDFFLRETFDRYTLVIQATDSGIPSLYAETAVLIFITDEKNRFPIFAQTEYTAEIQENVYPGTHVTQVSSIDTGARMIDFLMVDAQFDPYFSVNKSTGEITVREPPNREIRPYYYFSVQAVERDTAQVTDRCKVTVVITDVNDNSPRFEAAFYSGEVAFNDASFRGILKLKANDADSGENGAVVYSLKEPSVDFELGSSTGDLTKATGDDLPRKQSYRLIAIARDSGAPSRATEVGVRIDTFVPEETVVSLRLQITYEDLMRNKVELQDGLTVALQRRYPNNRVVIWKVDRAPSLTSLDTRRRLLEASPGTTAYAYAVTDNATDVDLNSELPKIFAKTHELLAEWQDDPMNLKPKAVLLGQRLAHYLIEYVGVFDAVKQKKKPVFMETTEGIIIVVCVIIILLLILLIIGLLLYICTSRKFKHKCDQCENKVGPTDGERTGDASAGNGAAAGSGNMQMKTGYEKRVETSYTKNPWEPEGGILPTAPVQTSASADDNADQTAEDSETDKLNDYKSAKPNRSRKKIAHK